MARSSLRDLLPTFAVVEPNLLPESNGFVVSQVEIATTGLTLTHVGSHYFAENGKLCTFNASGKIVDYATGKALFIHYDDELPVGYVDSFDGYAEEVEADNSGNVKAEQYIRLIRLVPGAIWTTTIASDDATYAAAISDGKIVKVKDTKLNGKAAYQYMCIAM